MTLRTQFVLAFGLLAALPVVLFGLATSKTAEDTEIARADREALLASTSLARELGRIMEGHAEVARSLATEVSHLEVVDAAALDERARHYMAFFPGLYCAFYVDEGGTAVAGMLSAERTQRSMAGTFYADREWFQQIRAGAPIASELLRSRTTGRPAVIFAAQATPREGSRIAVGGVGVELGPVQRALERVTETAPGLATVVFDPSGRVVVAAGGSAHRTSLANLGRLSLYRSAAGDAPEPRTGPDETGELRRGTVTRVESKLVAWSVTTTWPQASVRQRAVKALGTMVMFALAALALGLGVAIALSHALSRPVSRLSALIEAIGSGDLRARPASPEPYYAREFVEFGATIERTLDRMQTIMRQLGRTAVAVRDVTRRLGETSGRMLARSQAQRDAVQRSSGAIVQITDSMAGVGTSVRGLSDTASHNASTIVGLDKQIEQITISLRTLAKVIEGAVVHGLESQKQVAAIADTSAQLGTNVENTQEFLRGLTESIETVAHRAEQSRALAREALVAAEAGRVAVDETIHATQEIQSRFAAVGAAVDELAGRSESIGEVASVIERVMDATRLLGLNASIIASEAGEHGRMFGVVAERVRAMATETASSIQTITKLVVSVQSDIREAVQAVRHGQQTVQAGERRSAEAGVRLRAIIGSSGEAERTVQEIAEATRDQAERVVAVQAALMDVRDATKRIESAVETQRHVQRNVDVAIAQVRSVGDDVRGSTEAQQVQSQAMTAAVRAMTNRFQAIGQAINAQTRERARIESSLGVFDDASKSTVEFAQQLGEVVRTLADRLDQLERELGTFRVE
jgi:methyl-accepting chemotaxis protein